MRIKDPECIRFEPKADGRLKISPALFVPLLENAFKFADLRGAKPCIEIKISSDDSKVLFEIVNIYDRNSRKRNEKSGYGMANLRKRLDLSYPGKHTLSIGDDGKYYRATLMINTDEN
jgi:LytS/YehU family sensor histidine kinase